MQRLLLVTVLALGAGAAQADDGPFYVGAGISRNKLSQITNGGFSFSDISHTSWKAFVGVRPISLFAVEADYLDLGSGSRTIIAPGVGACVAGRRSWRATPPRPDARGVG